MGCGGGVGRYEGGGGGCRGWKQLRRFNNLRGNQTPNKVCWFSQKRFRSLNKYLPCHKGRRVSPKPALGKWPLPTPGCTHWCVNLTTSLGPCSCPQAPTQRREAGLPRGCQTAPKIPQAHPTTRVATKETPEPPRVDSNYILTFMRKHNITRHPPTMFTASWSAHCVSKLCNFLEASH